MPEPSIDRSRANTAPAVNRLFAERLTHNVERYAAAGRDAVGRRLGELDREWDVERVIELEAPATIALGVALGSLVDRRWYALSAFAAGMVLLHSVQGWYPLLPLLRRLGLRTQQEIESERLAMRALLGEQRHWQDSPHPGEQP